MHTVTRWQQTRFCCRKAWTSHQRVCWKFRPSWRTCSANWTVKWTLWFSLSDLYWLCHRCTCWPDYVIVIIFQNSKFLFFFSNTLTKTKLWERLVWVTGVARRKKHSLFKTFINVYDCIVLIRMTLTWLNLIAVTTTCTIVFNTLNSLYFRIWEVAVLKRGYAWYRPDKWECSSIILW